MILIGLWVESRIYYGVLRAASTAAAHYMYASVSEPLQELAKAKVLSTDARQRLLEIKQASGPNRSTLDIKVWRSDGSVAFATQADAIGTKPPMTSELASALVGNISAEFNDTQDVESKSERRFGKPIYEIYVPIYKVGTQRIIAVAEFYEDATDLIQDLRDARLQSRLVVGMLTMAMLAIPFGMLRRVCRQKRDQERILEQTFAQQSVLMRQHERLKIHVAEVRRQHNEAADKMLKRVGADLHDGPAQLLSLALMRLDEVAQPQRDTSVAPGRESSKHFHSVRTAIQDALEEIRSISAGVRLPALDHLSSVEVVRLAISQHEQRTGTAVTCDVQPLPESLPPDAKNCLYRCVQEALNNAFRHADGKGQHVSVSSNSQHVTLIVRDAGPGFPSMASVTSRSDRLGLIGLRQRVNALGGRLECTSSPGQGAQISIILPQAPHT